MTETPNNSGFSLEDGRRIGPGEPVFIVAEAGSNWRCGTASRDMQMAKSLIDVAAACECDAVKFQTYRAETVYVENAGSSDYLSDCGIRQSISDIFKDLAMPYEMIGELAEYCRSRGIMFMSSPFSVHDAVAVDPHVCIHKLASYEISHLRLIEYLAGTGKPLILSTGAAEHAEIQWALETWRGAGGGAVVLMQCTAKYPCPPEAVNVRALLDLRERYQVPVGLSDHSRDPVIAPVAAVAAGASCIEKHFTLHNALPGPDHPFAITPDELEQLVTAVRGVEKVCGTGRKEVLGEEKELRAYAQRSLQATRDIQTGERLREGSNYDILRSGQQNKGLHPRFLADIEGKKATRDIVRGEGICQGDYE